MTVGRWANVPTGDVPLFCFPPSCLLLPFSLFPIVYSPVPLPIPFDVFHCTGSYHCLFQVHPHLLPLFRLGTYNHFISFNFSRHSGGPCPSLFGLVLYHYLLHVHPYPGFAPLRRAFCCCRLCAAPGLALLPLPGWASLWQSCALSTLSSLRQAKIYWADSEVAATFHVSP